MFCGQNGKKLTLLFVKKNILFFDTPGIPAGCVHIDLKKIYIAMILN